MDWTRQFDEARTLSDEAATLLAERNQATVERQDAAVSRLSAALRRKLTSLNTKAAALEGDLLSDGASEREGERRRDAVLRLRSQIAQLSTELNKKAPPSSLRLAERPREVRWNSECSQEFLTVLQTLETAERDEHGLLILQRSLMSEQDDQLEDLSRTLVSTKHVALAVNGALARGWRPAVCSSPLPQTSWTCRRGCWTTWMTTWRTLWAEWRRRKQS